MTTDSQTTPDVDQESAKLLAIFRALRDEMDQITGFEEQVVEDTFGHNVWDAYDAAMGEGGTRNSLRLARMIAFVRRLRDGEQPKPAHEAVLAMTSREVDDVLNVEVEPAAIGEDPDNPQSESGKDASA